MRKVERWWFDVVQGGPAVEDNFLRGDDDFRWPKNMRDGREGGELFLERVKYSALFPPSIHVLG